MNITPGGRLAQLRRETQKTQEDIAQAIGTSRAYVARVEKGTSDLTNPETIERYAAALDVSTDTIYEIVGRIPGDIEEALRQGDAALFARVRAAITEEPPA